VLSAVDDPVNMDVCPGIAVPSVRFDTVGSHFDKGE